jgi:hypothetical protein
MGTTVAAVLLVIIFVINASGGSLVHAAGTSIPVSKGGTGATSPYEALMNLLPSYAGNDGKVLGLNAGQPAWVVPTDAGSATVTSFPHIATASATVRNSSTSTTAGGISWTATEDCFVKVKDKVAGSGFWATTLYLNEETLLNEVEYGMNGTAEREMMYPVIVKAGETVRMYRSIEGTLSGVSMSITSYPLEYVTSEGTVVDGGGSGGAMVPDYAKMEGTNRASTTGWTVEEDGFVDVYVNVQGPANTAFIYINDKVVLTAFANLATYTDTAGGIFPVKAGDVVRFSGLGALDTATCFFIPPRFVDGGSGSGGSAVFVTPDYGKIQNGTNLIPDTSTVWYADKQGFIRSEVRTTTVGTNASIELRINDRGALYVRGTGASGQDLSLFGYAPVSVGDKVELIVNNATITSGYCNHYFVPPKYSKPATPIVVEGGDYSTSEQPVMVNDGGTLRAKLWLDGRPIYRRTFQVTNFAGDAYSANNLDLMSSGLGTLIDFRLIDFYDNANYHVTGGNGLMEIPPSTNTPRVYVRGFNYNNGTLRVIFNQDTAYTYNGYIIAEYTKSTD